VVGTIANEMVPAAFGLLGDAGWRDGLRWARAEQARHLAGQMTALGEVVKNSHRSHTWAHDAVCSRELLAWVTGLLGPDVAVENSFLIIKPPGSDFEVPWHQDGINDDIELDPNRSLAVWLALTDATAANGAVQVLPGSHSRGYLPYAREDSGAPAAGRGRALAAQPPQDSGSPITVPVLAGEALAMDVRLLHRSGANATDRPRVGLNIRYVAPGAFRRGDPAERPGWLPIAGDGWGGPTIP
jgi:ectoine hydroxylase-related dioxygenase (phytanoyl-CoA dioxygenase family)